MSDVIDLPKLKEITFGRDSLVFYGQSEQRYYCLYGYWYYGSYICSLQYRPYEYSYLTMKGDIYLWL